MGHGGVLFINRHIVRLQLSIGKANRIGRLRTGKDHLGDAQLHRSLYHIICAEGVLAKTLAIGANHDTRHGGKMNNCVIFGNARSRLQFMEIRILGHRANHLTCIAQINQQLGHIQPRRGAVRVNDSMALALQIRDRVTARLAATAGEKDAHDYPPVCKLN